MRMVIIGANGLVGRALISLLRTKPGVHIIAGVRNLPAGNPVNNASGIEYSQIEAHDFQSIKQALTGATHVVNCIMGAPADMLAATRNICQAALEQSGIHVIHMSSCAVYGSLSGPIDEQSPVGQGVDWYGQAKIECEIVVRDYAARGLATTTLRPSCIYGPSSYLWTTRIGRLLKAHRLGDMGRGADGVCNIVYLKDVTEAIWASAQMKKKGQVFILSQPLDMTWGKYLIDYAEAIRATPISRITKRQLDVDRLLLSPLLKIADIALNKLRIRHAWLPDPITPSLLRTLALKVHYNGTLAAQKLDCYKMSVESGLDQSAKWFNGSKSI